MTRIPTSARILKLSAQGRTVIPADFRRALGLRDGDELVAWMQDDQVVISTRRAVAARTRGMYSHLGEGAVDGLIAERRAEARREDEESRATEVRRRRDDGS